MSAPPVDIKITGGMEMQALGRKIRAAGEGGNLIRKELLKEIRAEGPAIRTKVRASARESMPKRGGLNDWLAGVRVSMATSTTGNRVGVRVKGAKGKHDIKAINRGRLRHPVYGHRDRWKTQSIEPGFFDKPIAAMAPELRASVRAAMDAAARKLEAL